MHNLSTVTKFEIKRTLKKKSFWITSLMFPLLIGAVAGIIYFSNKATDTAQKEASEQKFSLVVTDRSKLVNPALLSSFDATITDDKSKAIADVETGKYDAYFYYPSDLQIEKVEVYGRDVGLFDNSRYEAVAKILLKESATATTDANLRSVLSDAVGFNSTTYRDGKVYDGIRQLIAPAIFLVLFYLLIATFGNQMLTSTTEEKENRVIEMILTTVHARTLIIGKVLSLIVLALIQMVIVLTPVIVGYIFLHDRLSLPNIDLSNIPLDPVRISIGAVIFFLSFLLFTGLLVAIGAAVPTAKEAGGFFGAVMVLLFGPLYAVTLFVSSPDSPIVQVLSYFPFTAPIPLMLRNAVGNLEIWQAGISIAILAVTAAIVMAIGVRLFKYGALQYDRRLGFKDLFS